VKALWQPSAALSACGTYRYRLTREQPCGLFFHGKCIAPAEQPAPSVLWVMLNPSVADGLDDDPTIRAVTAFTEGWGFSRFEVANLFAFRATDPKDLWAAQARGVNIVGPENDKYLLGLARTAALVVCAWGANELYDPLRAVDVRRMLRDVGARPHVLGFTAEGSPKHPLARGKAFIPRDAKPQPWEAA
jgi:hypothetical protein